MPRTPEKTPRASKPSHPQIHNKNPKKAGNPEKEAGPGKTQRHLGPAQIQKPASRAVSVGAKYRRLETVYVPPSAGSRGPLSRVWWSSRSLACPPQQPRLLSVDRASYYQITHPWAAISRRRPTPGTHPPHYGVVVVVIVDEDVATKGQGWLGVRMPPR